ncbi:hypothetical protein Tco_1329033, partial [Tanacetum coccineum]
LLTPLCFDDTDDVTPYVSALAGCDILVSELGYREVVLSRPTGYSISEDPEDESIEEEPFEEPKEEGLCTHAKRQGRECDSKNAVWPGPTNEKKGRGGADKGPYYDLRDMYGGHIVTRLGVHVSDSYRSWWKIYFEALVDIAEGIENTAKTCVRLIILKQIDKAKDIH